MANKKKAKRKAPTWTFQPDADVAEKMENLLKEKGSALSRTQTINEALRLFGDRAAEVVAKVEAAEKEAARRTRAEAIR